MKSLPPELRKALDTEPDRYAWAKSLTEAKRREYLDILVRRHHGPYAATYDGRSG